MTTTTQSIANSSADNHEVRFARSKRVAEKIKQYYKLKYPSDYESRDGITEQLYFLLGEDFEDELYYVQDLLLTLITFFAEAKEEKKSLPEGFAERLRRLYVFFSSLKDHEPASLELEIGYLQQIGYTYEKDALAKVEHDYSVKIKMEELKLELNAA